MAPIYVKPENALKVRLRIQVKGLGRRRRGVQMYWTGQRRDALPWGRM